MPVSTAGLGMPDVRPVSETDREEWRRLTQYGFRPTEGPGVEPPAEWPPTLGEPWGVYDGDELCSVCARYELPARLGETATAVGGLGAVATAPDHRRQGHVRRLCRAAIADYESRDVPLVALWPFSDPFYEQFGWASAYSYARIEAPPGAFPAHDATGRMRRQTVDDWERLQAADARHSRDARFELRRTEGWWRERTFGEESYGPVPYCYGYERDGELAGYLLYTFDRDGDRLAVSNLAFADEEAKRAALAFLESHEGQVEQVVVRTTPDGEFLARVPDPSEITCELHTGPMIRLTSVDALAAFDWPGALDCRLAVTDPLRADRTVRLHVADGAATVEPTDRAPDATIGIGGLSQLAVGTHAPSRAERVGGLTVHEPSVREPLADVFRPGPVHVRQFF